MKSVKKLLRNISVCSARHLPKLALAMLVMTLISYFFLAFAVTPFAAVVASNASSMRLLAAVGFSAFAVSVLNTVLQYGFFVLTLLLYTGKRAVLGHLFTGFRDFKRALTAALFFMLLYAVFTFALVFALGAAGSRLLSNTDFSQLLQNAAENSFSSKRTSLLLAIGIALVLSFVVFALIYLRYGFTWFFLYENSSLSVRQALRKSAVFAKAQRMRFFVLCVKSCWRYALCALLLTAHSFGITGAASHPFFRSLQLFDPLFSMASTLCLYIAVIRVCIAFAAFYDEQSTNTVGSSGSGSLSSAGIGLSDTDDGAHSGTGTGGSRENHTGALPEKT